MMKACHQIVRTIYHFMISSRYNSTRPTMTFKKSALSVLKLADLSANDFHQKPLIPAVLR